MKHKIGEKKNDIQEWSRDFQQPIRSNNEKRRLSDQIYCLMFIRLDCLDLSLVIKLLCNTTKSEICFN